MKWIAKLCSPSRYPPSILLAISAPYLFQVRISTGVAPQKSNSSPIKMIYLTIIKTKIRGPRSEQLLRSSHYKYIDSDYIRFPIGTDFIKEGIIVGSASNR